MGVFRLVRVYDPFRKVMYGLSPGVLESVHPHWDQCKRQYGELLSASSAAHLFSELNRNTYIELDAATAFKLKKLLLKRKEASLEELFSRLSNRDD